MLKETITYKNFDGKEVVRDLYFNLNEAEIHEMEFTTPGGYKGMLERIVAAQDMPSLFLEFKAFILKAYGEKSADGEYLHKSPEISKRFEDSQAYSDFFIKLISSPENAANFVNRVIPNVPEKGDNPTPVAATN